MNRFLLLVLACASSGCGSRLIISPASIAAFREGDGKVLVTARLGLQSQGVDSNEIAPTTEFCMSATWSEPLSDDAGTSDAGTSDAGTSDAGSPDAGVSVGSSDAGVTTRRITAVGATLSTVTQCQRGLGGVYELRSTVAIPVRDAIVTLTPFESGSNGNPPIQFTAVQFDSP